MQFASYYANLINIDIDNDSDGLPDYYESNVPLYNGNRIVTSTYLQDTDGDTLKDGEEIIIYKEYIPLTNNVRVYAKMLSDPRDEDTDHDGIEDHDDTDPLHKGMAGGIVGELSIVSYADMPDHPGGHSFLIYHSFVNDIINVSKLKSGFKADKKPNGAINWIRSYETYYEIQRGHYITFGAMTDSTAGALLNSIPDNLSSLLDNRGTEGGVYYNEEANSLLAEGDLHYDYQPNSCLSSELTDTQLSQLLNYLGDNNYYNLLYHNCSTVASGAWNYIFNDNLNARITLVSYNIASVTGITIVSFDAPLMLRVDITGRSNLTYCFDDLVYHFSEERGLI